MTAQQILRQAIRAYNIDTFDEEQKHLHVTLSKWLWRLEATDSPEFNRISLVIPNKETISTYYNENDEERSYQELLISFIHYSLNNLSK